MPPDATLRASVAHLLGERYAFTAQAAPRLRAALGLDLAPVQAAHLRRYGRRLATICAPRVLLAGLDITLLLALSVLALTRFRPEQL